VCDDVHVTDGERGEWVELTKRLRIAKGSDR
jgi:hypothetical protein